jgi:hypothetical protein
MISSLKSTFDLANRRALYICPGRVTIYHWSRGNLDSTYSFDASAEGQANFELYLAGMPDDVIYILVDTPDEEFRLDSIPHVMGGDRRALLNRKRNRHFRNAHYTYTEIQGRESGGRRDDRVLFSCISNNEILEPWIALLLKYKVPVAGIYSVALLSKYLLPHLDESSGSSLIVSFERNAGLRQTYYKNGEFKFSRLVKAPRYGTSPYAPFVAGEMQKMLRYLRSMRQINAEQDTNIYLLGDDALLGDLRKQTEDGGGIRHHYVSLKDLSNRLGMETEFIDPFAEVVYIYLLLDKCPSNLYATGSDTSYYQMRRMRNSMLAASLVIIVASMIWGGLNFMDGMSLKQQALSADAKADFYNDRYIMAKERLPEIPLEPAQLKVAVDAARALKGYRVSPIDMMRTLSTGLEDFPEFRIDQIQWVVSLDPDYGTERAEPAGRDRRRQARTEIRTTGSQTRYYQIAGIKGHLEPFDGNYRQAISRVNEFVEHLRGLERVHDVRIISSPLDVSSEARLQGIAERPTMDANYEIRVVINPDIEHEA